MTWCSSSSLWGMLSGGLSACLRTVKQKMQSLTTRQPSKREKGKSRPINRKLKNRRTRKTERLKLKGINKLKSWPKLRNAVPNSSNSSNKKSSLRMNKTKSRVFSKKWRRLGKNICFWRSRGWRIGKRLNSCFRRNTRPNLQSKSS